jgi:beta-glucosidase
MLASSGYASQITLLVLVSVIVYSFMYSTSTFLTSPPFPSPIVECLQVDSECPSIPIPQTHAGHEWITYSDILAQSAIDFNKDNPNVDVIFLGDSITEAFLGTSIGQQRNRGNVPEAFTEAIDPLLSAVYGVAGDQTQHLLWRMQNAEYLATNVKVIAILIGTNNLSRGHSPEATFAGCLAVVEEARTQAPGARIVLNTILTRDDKFQGAVEVVNTLILQMDIEGVTIADCAVVFGNNNVNLALMPDGLHPNGPGTTAWFDLCLKEFII